MIYDIKVRPYINDIWGIIYHTLMIYDITYIHDIIRHFQKRLPAAVLGPTQKGVCVCAYVYIYIYIYTHIHTYIHTCIHTYIMI